MLGFIGKRLIAMVLTMWAVSFVAFAIIQLPPGDYLTTYMATLAANGDRVDPDTIEALRRQYGFGEPYIIQYWKWISGIVLRGDFGQSFEWKAPVTTLIWGRLGNSILLEGLAVIVMWLVAVPIGIYAAVRKYSLGDYLATIGGFLGLAIPKEMGGSGEGTNPEQLFAAGYAACFHSALQMVARAEKANVADSAVGARVGIGPNGAGGFGLAVTLEVSLPHLPHDQAVELTEKAHQVCPYSNATRGNIEVTLEVSKDDE